jgi:hypothetical protein
VGGGVCICAGSILLIASPSKAEGGNWPLSMLVRDKTADVGVEDRRRDASTGGSWTLDLTVAWFS